jgi:hypothetical protein
VVSEIPPAESEGESKAGHDEKSDDSVDGFPTLSGVVVLVDEVGAPSDANPRQRRRKPETNVCPTCHDLSVSY